MTLCEGHSPEVFIKSPFYPISKPQRQSQREWLLFNSWIWHCHLFVNSVSPQTESDTSFVKPGTKRKILNYQELQDSKNRILPTHRIVSKGFLFPWTLSLLTHMLLRFPINQCHMSFTGYNIFDMIPWSLLYVDNAYTWMYASKYVSQELWEMGILFFTAFLFFQLVYLFIHFTPWLQPHGLRLVDFVGLLMLSLTLLDPPILPPTLSPVSISSP